MKRGLITISLVVAIFNCHSAEKTDGFNVDRNAYFGDLHVHTKNSSDAFIFNVKATPDDAYNYSKGKTIQHISGFPIQLKGGSLDFTAVTDHAELLGVFTAMTDKSNPNSASEIARNLQSSDRKKVVAAFLAVVGDTMKNGNESAYRDLNVIRSAWQETIESAERHYQPGIFTTFVGYEYSSSPKNQNLHRNVIFRSAKVPKTPFSSIDSDNPEDLWKWLDKMRNKGMDALAIPHNSNVSNGLMFERTDWSGRPIDENYAKLRMRNEPLVEITQVKGTSETHPSLSPNDEWADFELYDTLIASKKVSKKPGGFVREAYLNGIEFQANSNFNPYKFGLVGATDSHNAGGAIEESQYSGKVGSLDGTAKLRGTTPSYVSKTFGRADAAETFSQWSASGLTGIWAEENTRESLFDAMKRKETFATSGPRIRLRFFAGFDFEESLLNSPELIQKAYQSGVSMGSDLESVKGKQPSFLLWASQDTQSTKLQRLQIIKGWIEDGKGHERVFDVACSDGLKPDRKTQRCPDNGAQVNLTDCTVSMDKGAIELKTLWQDPNYDEHQQAFYYVRVLENPSCRWSSWDALRAGAKPKKGIKPTLQERAWSSPIWLMPPSS